ncbi:MAG: DegT/DnrJ/EryC1/StrS family aminotransferase, partial [bacterium]
FNYRMDAIQAAVLLVKLKHLAAWNEERRRIATVYHGYFKKNERIQTITEPDGLYSVYLQYVVQIENRDEVRQKLAEDGIGTGRPSSEPMHKYPAFEHFVIGEKRFRVAESVASRLLSLPIYPHLTNTVVENAAMKVIEIVDSI